MSREQHFTPFYKALAKTRICTPGQHSITSISNQGIAAWLIQTPSQISEEFLRDLGKRNQNTALETAISAIRPYNTVLNTLHNEFQQKNG